MEVCRVCGMEADLRCKNCKNAFYCGKECQLKDWKDGHNFDCHNKSEPIGVTLPPDLIRKQILMADVFDLPDWMRTNRWARDYIRSPDFWRQYYEANFPGVPYVTHAISYDRYRHLVPLDPTNPNHDRWQVLAMALVRYATTQETRADLRFLKPSGASVKYIYFSPYEEDYWIVQGSFSPREILYGISRAHGTRAELTARLLEHRGMFINAFEEGYKWRDSRRPPEPSGSKKDKRPQTKWSLWKDKARAILRLPRQTEEPGPEPERKVRYLSDAVDTVEAVCPPPDPRRGLINYADIKFGKELGRGAFGVVAAGTHRGQPVAIKTVQGQPTPAAIKEFSEEAQLLASLPAHPNVVRFIGITQNPLVLVTELVTGGGLDSRLKPGKPAVLWSDVMKWARDIARGIGHLHAHDILHRDMATRNVLLDDKGNAKVTDFGLSRRICTQDPELRFRQQEFFRGPYKWMPPESLANQDFSVKSDTWAYGVTLWEIASRRAPFEFLDIETVKKWVITNHMRLPLPQRWPQRVRDLMMSCWRTNPAERPIMPSISAILRAIGDSAYNGRPLAAISDQEIRQLYGI